MYVALWLIGIVVLLFQEPNPHPKGTLADEIKHLRWLF